MSKTRYYRMAKVIAEAEILGRKLVKGERIFFNDGDYTNTLVSNITVIQTDSSILVTCVKCKAESLSRVVYKSGMCFDCRRSEKERVKKEKIAYKNRIPRCTRCNKPNRLGRNNWCCLCVTKVFTAKAECVNCGMTGGMTIYPTLGSSNGWWDIPYRDFFPEDGKHSNRETTYSGMTSPFCPPCYRKIINRYRESHSDSYSVTRMLNWNNWLEVLKRAEREREDHIRLVIRSHDLEDQDVNPTKDLLYYARMLSRGDYVNIRDMLNCLVETTDGAEWLYERVTSSKGRLK